MCYVSTPSHSRFTLPPEIEPETTTEQVEVIVSVRAGLTFAQVRQHLEDIAASIECSEDALHCSATDNPLC